MQANARIICLRLTKKWRTLKIHFFPSNQRQEGTRGKQDPLVTLLGDIEKLDHLIRKMGRGGAIIISLGESVIYCDSDPLCKVVSTNLEKRILAPKVTKIACKRAATGHSLEVRNAPIALPLLLI